MAPKQQPPLVHKESIQKALATRERTRQRQKEKASEPLVDVDNPGEYSRRAMQSLKTLLVDVLGSLGPGHLEVVDKAVVITVHANSLPVILRSVYRLTFSQPPEHKPRRRLRLPH